MTREEALKIALENYEIHKIAADTFSIKENLSIVPTAMILSKGEGKRADICQVIIDVFEGRTPTGNVNEALTVLRREKEKYEGELSYSLSETVSPAYIEKYKRCVDWYTCCIEALDDYLFEYGGEE